MAMEPRLPQESDKERVNGACKSLILSPPATRDRRLQAGDVHRTSEGYLYKSVRSAWGLTTPKLFALAADSVLLPGGTGTQVKEI